MHIKIYTPYLLLLLLFKTSHSSSLSTTKEVPLYIRQSWIKRTDSIRTACICESNAKPSDAYKLLMLTQVTNDPCLKCFIKCLKIKLNLMDATTGNLIEKEFIRQIEGVTPEIFKKCNEKVREEIDLCEKSFGMFLCVVHVLAVPKTTE
ncbi:hypothetical protein FQR65_LT03316 [Abscondita terminalis]|nr:hypothetical protein FQR65_LT03316 [Abscondita terminalis]